MEIFTKNKENSKNYTPHQAKSNHTHTEKHSCKALFPLYSVRWQKEEINCGKIEMKNSNTCMQFTN